MYYNKWYFVGVNSLIYVQVVLFHVGFSFCEFKSGFDTCLVYLFRIVVHALMVM